jgi:hypothetical protein
MSTAGKLSPGHDKTLLNTLQTRFEKHPHRHPHLSWQSIQKRLELLPVKTREVKLWSLHEMERTGGEPDVIGIDPKTSEIIVMDCASESPAGRRSLCYDREALDTRKENKPAGNVLDMAAAMGIELLNEEQYRQLQSVGPFDTKTSSWLLTPAPIRKQGGAIFGDYRYGQTFIYHNGAQSYYAARGFRGLLKV